jgi:hypothetical protein
MTKLLATDAASWSNTQRQIEAKVEHDDGIDQFLTLGLLAK